jgi:DNA-directed RNA polymerase specialized sigma24 family protein
MDGLMAWVQSSENKGRPRIEEALEALTMADQVRLKRIAQIRAAGIPGVEWDDLLQEAIMRLLSGSRQCPQDVPFMACLLQTIRSIAHEARQHGKLMPIASCEDAGDVGVIDELTFERPGPESQAIVRNQIEWIQSMFKNDAESLTVLHALAEGLSPEETVSKVGMTLKRYQSAQKRIRRKLANIGESEI